MITVFKNILTVDKPKHVQPEELFYYIKNCTYAHLIEPIRKLEDKKERDKIKKKLPSICWSGKFTKRANDSIISHSGLVCIDFDHVKNLNEFKERICKDEYVFIAFISPSGDGLKVIIKIPAKISTHADSCRALTKYFQHETLDEFRDIARVCYISCDNDIYLNPKSKVFTDLEPEITTTQTQVFYPKERISDTNEIYDRIVKWLDSRDTYTDGNKHNYLVKLSAACTRFGLSETECAIRLYSNYSNAASKVSQDDINKIVSRIYANYSASAGTAYFEQAGKPIYTATKKEVKDDIFDIDINGKDIIYLENVRQSMFEGFKTGKAKGTTTYLKSFDEHWTWRKKEVTFVGGIGNIGKTTMINNLCVLKAMHEGWKFAFFTPEQDPPDDFYNDLIHTYVGESTEPYHENQMSEMRYKEAMKFIEKHFFYIYPESESPTPDYINQCFAHAIKKHNIDVCIVDPFNQLDNDWRKEGRDDLYISKFLSNCKRFSQKHNVGYMIAGHPNSSLQLANGNYEMPTVYKYSGGAMWNNKCDNILCYHRPYAITEPKNTECYFVSQKIKKRKLTGIPGQSIMNFNVLTNRFVESDGSSPFKESKIEQLQIDNSDLQVPDEYITPITEKESPF